MSYGKRSSLAAPSGPLAAGALGLGTAAVIFLLRCLRPTWPGMLIAAALAALATPQSISIGVVAMARSRS